MAQLRMNVHVHVCTVEPLYCRLTPRKCPRVDWFHCTVPVQLYAMYMYMLLLYKAIKNVLLRNRHFGLYGGNSGTSIFWCSSSNNICMINDDSILFFVIQSRPG